MRRTLLALLLVSVCGCQTSMGPSTIPGARFDYNEAVVRSFNEQLLLNLVRLRYRDTPLFLDVTGIVTQFSFDAGVGGSAAVRPGPDKNSYGAALGFDYGENPTISYAPLQGTDFVKRLLSPIPPETLVMLGQSGWSIERLLLACAREVNGVMNAPGAGGPTPDYAPRHEEFQELARLLRKMQVAGEIGVVVVPTPPTEGIHLTVNPAVTNAAGDNLRRMRETLRLSATASEYRVIGSTYHRSPESIAVVGRSVLGVMYYLSQAVEAPAEHERRGLVTVTRDASGGRFDWGKITGPLLSVRSSSGSPDSAFVKVEYRGHWFYIDDADLNSKSTFGLLTQLFSLQSATGTSSGPLLTIPTGG